jgi:hypothetical protein
VLSQPDLDLGGPVVRGVVEDAVNVAALVVPRALLEQLDELEGVFFSCTSASTRPVRTLNAANRFSTPCRTYSNSR